MVAYCQPANLKKRQSATPSYHPKTDQKGNYMDHKNETQMVACVVHIPQKTSTSIKPQQNQPKLRTEKGSYNFNQKTNITKSGTEVQPPEGFFLGTF